MGPIENFGRKAFDLNVTQPASRITAKVGAETDPMSKGSTFAGEFLKESALLPLRNIGAISNFIWGKSFNLLGSILKTGANAAMLIPLPLPGGARVRGTNDGKDLSPQAA